MLKNLVGVLKIIRKDFLILSLIFSKVSSVEVIVTMTLVSEKEFDSVLLSIVTSN